MGSALLYYLAQTWTADRYRQAQHDAPARAASRARHSRPSRRPSRPRAPRPWWRAACAPCWAAAAHDRHTAAQARQSRLPGSPGDECRHRDPGHPQAGQRGRCDRHQDLPGSATTGRQAHGGGYIWAVARVVMYGRNPAAAHPGISRDGPAGQHRAGRPAATKERSNRR